MDRLEAFFAHWRSLPRSGLLPSLRDYLDHPHPDVQPWTMILDVEPTGLPVRLFGAGLAEFAGMDGTGMDFTLAAPENSRELLLARDTLCATHPCGLKLGMHATTNTGRTFLNTVLVLPVVRGPAAYSLIRVSNVGPVVELDDTAKPMSVKHYTLAEWIDLGGGIPAQQPGLTQSERR